MYSSFVFHLWRNVCLSLLALFNWIICACFFLLLLVCTYIFRILTPYQIMVYRYFLPFFRLPFILLIVPLLCRRFTFDVILFIFVYVACASGVISKKSLTRSMSRSFSSLNFAVSGLFFRSTIHFELIFEYDMK